MAFSDLCHISNPYKTIENDLDQSLGIMEENSMVRELITKILDESVPTETSTSSTSPSENEISLVPVSTNVVPYPKTEPQNSYQPAIAYNAYQDANLYPFGPQTNEQNAFNFNVQNGFGNTNGFVNYTDNDATLLALDPVTEVSTEAVTPEHLNLLRLAAQEIGGAQFASPNKYDNYNFYEPSQRNSLPEANMFTNNFNRPNSLNLDMNFNANFENPYVNGQRFPNKFENYVKEQCQESPELASYLNQLSLAPDRVREDPAFQNEYKMALEMNGHFDEYKLQEERNKVVLYNRNYVLQNKNFNGDNNNFYLNDMISQMGERSPMNQNYDFPNQSPVQNAMNYKPNGFHPPNEFMQRRDMKMMPRDGFQNGNVEQRMNYDNALARENQQQALMRQNQEVARQMGLIMRNGPPPVNQLNVDVSFLHENNPYNIANIGAMLAPNPSVPPPVVQSPMVDIPLLMPYYAMRGMRSTASSASVLHARLDASYEQWKQLERERKRTEARLALAYPGRAVSSSNSIPVPRLSQCPSRLERIAVDMYREHTKVVTLMGKMETLRASACVAQNRKPNKPDDAKITVLKRGQEVHEREREVVVDPATFDPHSWMEDVKTLPTSPHKDIESALVKWKATVDYVLALRKRELNPHTAPPIPHANHVRFMRDPALEMAEALRAMCKGARRVRCAMWYDLTLTVALAPPHHAPHTPTDKSPQESSRVESPKKSQEKPTTSTSGPTTSSKAEKVEVKEEKQTTEQPKPSSTTETETKPPTKQNEKQEQQTKNQQRRPQYRHKVQRNDFYKQQRYDHRFVHRHPYYLATGPIN
ncbi:uncharacterized protein [Epargyreus clarus]|uniref:uncharacterized protein n=1 Tax=Epargyreus clarus TaxID=520877 RepID=UPI003C2F521A